MHNERIERMWSDVHRCIASTYADAFRNLESEDLFDSLNEVDLSLHISTMHQQKHF